MTKLNLFKKAIVYEMLIDRFSGPKFNDWDKPEFLVGNIKGIFEKLSYLIDIGVNTILISPL